ncbi:hypothetical protein MtrunA17_Chr7g0270331 [Medicago truncatula]|uniref:Transmembrane protein, putative n=1 Tax=Medicago truncatula TaxID=3880 RepID=A0A072U514_MEDTR|nr:transmembrane protein, putative [Medicago truncatula]RHN49050.1 hypothetical protein MtrunA17_Chr7g0270331 [Medicago truncatula]
MSSLSACLQSSSMDTSTEPRLPSQIIVSFRPHASASCGCPMPLNKLFLLIYTRHYLPLDTFLYHNLILENCRIYIVFNLTGVLLLTTLLLLFYDAPVLLSEHETSIHTLLLCTPHSHSKHM